MRLQVGLHKHLYRLVYGILALVLLAIPMAFSTLVSAEGQGFAQGYGTKDELLRSGMAVQLTIGDDVEAKFVERGSSDKPERIIGIATAPNSNFALIGSTKNEIFVQSSGQVIAYVSDLGGVVKKGDLLTISPLKGVLMKVGGTKTAELATALEDSNPDKAEEIQIDGGSTKSNTTKVNKVLISLDRHTFQSTQNDSDTLSRVSRALVGKDVGALRVLVSLLVFALLLVVEGGIVYGAISSSLTSIGRNPLAGKAIKRELIRVLMIAVFILLIGLGVVYTILWI